MGETDLEKRMTELERELVSLRRKVEGMTASTPWWERIAGTFENDPIYERAMKLGRKYRRSQRPDGPKPRET